MASPFFELLELQWITRMAPSGGHAGDDTDVSDDGFPFFLRAG